MTRYHVKSDGLMGVCTAREGHCPFGGDAGTRHFTNEAEARKYSEERVKAISSGKMRGDSFRKMGRSHSGDDNRVKTTADFKRLPARKTMMSSFIIEGDEFDAAPCGVEIRCGDYGRVVLIHMGKTTDNQPTEYDAETMCNSLIQLHDEYDHDGYSDISAVYAVDQDGDLYDMDDLTDTIPDDNDTLEGWFDHPKLSIMGRSLTTLDDLHQDYDDASTLTKNVTGSEEDFGSAVIESPDRVRPSTIEDYKASLDNPDDSISRITYEMNRFGLRGVADRNEGRIDVTIRGWDDPVELPDDVSSETIVRSMRDFLNERSNLLDSERLSRDAMDQALKNSESGSSSIHDDRM